jgi:hypothetical protein
MQRVNRRTPLIPRRTGQVHRLAVQAGDQLAQLAFAAGLRQRGVPDVVLEVEFFQFNPGRPRMRQPGTAQAVVPRRHELLGRAQVRHQVAQEIWRRVLGHDERHQPGDVHRRVA